jgi:ketosteroid isomerase-like protein
MSTIAFFTRCARRSALAMCLALGPVLAHADAFQDANKLFKEGHRTEALQKVDQYLADKPKDAQGRFLKGLILSDMNRQDEAISVFKKLTEDYPELPEPYNNLAVLYAQQKHYEKAKEELEMAIRTHPSYATAHENLGDIYARLASQAYDKALQLDSSNTTAQSKLAMIRELMGADGHPLPAHTAIAVAAAPAAQPAKVETKPAPAPADQAKIETTAAAKAESKGEEEPAVPAQATPIAAAIAPASTPAAAEPPLTGEISQVITAWADAWSKKNVKAYLSFYAKDFVTPGHASRASWENQRRVRISKPGTIQVGFEDLRLSNQDSDHVVAKFRQHYQSASIKTSSNKVLVLVKRNGKWLIQQERVGR